MADPQFMPRAQLVRNTLVSEIDRMLTDLGNPPLVERIFPKGWRTADDERIAQLYDLCGRTYASRSTTNG